MREILRTRNETVASYSCGLRNHKHLYDSIFLDHVYNSLLFKDTEALSMLNNFKEIIIYWEFANSVLSDYIPKVIKEIWILYS